METSPRFLFLRPRTGIDTTVSPIKIADPTRRGIEVHYNLSIFSLNILQERACR